MDELLQEIEVIQTIYCRDGEVVIRQKGPDAVVVSVHAQRPQSIKEVTLTLSMSPRTYPSAPPSISIQSPQLTRAECDDIKVTLGKSCEPMVDQPMLFRVISSFYDHLENLPHSRDVTPTLNSESDNLSHTPVTTCLLQLDHMRNRQDYSKTILRWTEKLDLVGRLIFCRKIILILLEGAKEAVKEYIRLNRSQVVDVDSRGRPCKERLLSVLFEEVTTKQRTYLEFASCEFSSLESVKSKLKEEGLLHLSQQLETLVKR